MITMLYRMIRYGFQGFLRNRWLSIATISVMTLTLFVFLSLMIFNVLTNQAINLLRDKIDISVYFQNSVSEDDILNLRRSLESLAEVKDVQYISRDEALRAFEQRHQDDPTITKAISILDENPLSASLNIKAKDAKDYPIIAAYLNSENLKSLIDKVTYNQNQLVINRLAAIVDTVQRTGFGLTIALSLISILVTLNTIILSIYSTRDEIGVMRLVGASNRFIRGPYVIQGMLYGAVSAIFGILIMAPIVIFASPYVGILIPEMNLQSYFISHLAQLTSYQLLLGMALGVISSVIAVGKYLKI